MIRGHKPVAGGTTEPLRMLRIVQRHQVDARDVQFRAAHEEQHALLAGQELRPAMSAVPRRQRRKLGGFSH